MGDGTILLLPYNLWPVCTYHRPIGSSNRPTVAFHDSWHVVSGLRRTLTASVRKKEKFSALFPKCVSLYGYKVFLHGLPSILPMHI